MNIIEQIQRAMLNGGEVPSAEVSLAPKTLAPVPVEQSRPVAQPRPVARSSGSGISSEGVPQFTVKNLAEHSGTVVRTPENRGLLSDNPNSYGSNDELETAMQQTKGSPTGAVLRGVNYGTNTATSQNEKGLMDGFMGEVSSLLGNIDIDRLIRVMGNPAFQQGSMGQEANVGQNLIRRLVESNYNVNQEDALAAETGQANQLAAYKAETDRIKEQGQSFPKPSAEITKMYQAVQAARSGLNLIDKMKTSISGASFGIGGDLKSALVGLGATLGYNTEVTDRQSIKQIADHIKTQIMQSGVFGREVSNSERKMLNDLVPSSSILDAQSKNKMMAAYKMLQEKFSRQAREGNALLVNVYGLKPIGEAFRGSGDSLISKREPLSGGS